MWMCLNPKFYSNVQQGATPLLAEPYFCHLIATVETDRKAKRERVEDMQQRVPGQIHCILVMWYICVYLTMYV